MPTANRRFAAGGCSKRSLAQDNQTTNESAANTKVVVLWWPLLVAAVLMIFSFWLGGMSKLYNLRKQADKRINY